MKELIEKMEEIKIEALKCAGKRYGLSTTILNAGWVADKCRDAIELIQNHQPTGDVVERVADVVHRVTKYKCDEIEARYIAKAAIAAMQAPAQVEE